MDGASKTPLFYILFDISINTQAIKNLNDTFLTKHPQMRKVKLKLESDL